MNRQKGKKDFSLYLYVFHSKIFFLEKEKLGGAVNWFYKSIQILQSFILLIPMFAFLKSIKK